MNGKEFIRRARAWARDRGLECKVDPSRGKGGHQTIYVGDRWTTVQTGELKPGTLSAMFRQLGIRKEEF